MRSRRGGGDRVSTLERGYGLPPHQGLAAWENEGGSVAPEDDGAHGAPADTPVRGVKRRGPAVLPAETADRFTKPLGRFLRVEATAAALLLVATIAALFLSNSQWSELFLTFWEIPVGLRFGPFEFGRSIQRWLNEGFMTLFFFVAALELKRELVLGELRGWRSAAFPLSGAIGGMVVPAAVYLVLMADRPGSEAWGTVVATDTAFVVGTLALLGRRIPTILRLFLLSLAIFDDVGGILVLALGYGSSFAWRGLALAAVGVILVSSVARLGIRSTPVYFVLGAFMWLGFDSSGVHPTMAGVLLGLMTPARGWVSDDRMRSSFEQVLDYPVGEHWSGDTPDRAHLQQAGRAALEVLSPLERLVMTLHPWVGVAIMPLFALANAGIQISGTGIGDPVTVAIFVSLAVGKPMGVIGMSWLAVRSGLATRPASLPWSFLSAGALLTGIGFTMSLLIAGLAFPATMLDAAKIGVLAGSTVSAVAGFTALAWLVRRPPG